MMTIRARRSARSSLCLLIAISVLAVACGGADAPPVEAQDADGYAQRAAAQLEINYLPQRGRPDEIWGRELELPLPAPKLELTATDGSTYSFARDAVAPVTLIYFGYTTCPDVCPAHMAALARAVSELGPARRADVDVLFVTVDPEVDDVERLQSYLENFDADFTGLTGTVDDVNDALTSLALPPVTPDENGLPEHPSSVLGYTADGKAHVVWPFGTTPAIYEHDLRLLVDRGADIAG